MRFNLIRAALLPIVCCAMAAPIAARGQIVTVDWVGQISSFVFRDDTGSTNLATHGLLGVGVGSAVRGSFAYDLAVNVDLNASPSIGAYHPALVSQTFQAGSFVKTLTPTIPGRILNFVNDANHLQPAIVGVDGIEAFSLSNLGDSIFGGNSLTQLGIAWLSPNTSLLTSDAMQVLPSGVNWINPGGPISFLDHNSATLQRLEIVANFVSYTLSTGPVAPGPVAPIPEPEIYAMMLAGLGVIGWMGRRKKLRDRGAT